MKEEERKYLLRVREAKGQKASLSFQYRHSDGQVIYNKAVYPRKIFTKGKHTYFKAYCYFTLDIRLFT